MINANSLHPTFNRHFETSYPNTGQAEELIERMKAANENYSKSFAIVIQKNSTASLFLIDIPFHSFQQKDSIPRVSYVAQDSTFHWVDKVVEFSGKSMEDAALKEIAEVTTKLKFSHGESQISAGLSQLSKHKLPDIVTIALLRNTFSLRSKVSCWEDFLEATENALNAKGKDPKKLLRGLKK